MEFISKVGILDNRMELHLTGRKTSWENNNKLQEDKCVRVGWFVDRAALTSARKIKPNLIWLEVKPGAQLDCLPSPALFSVCIPSSERCSVSGHE